MAKIKTKHIIISLIIVIILLICGLFLWPATDNYCERIYKETGICQVNRCFLQHSGSCDVCGVTSTYECEIIGGCDCYCSVCTSIPDGYGNSIDSLVHTTYVLSSLNIRDIDFYDLRNILILSLFLYFFAAIIGKITKKLRGVKKETDNKTRFRRLLVSAAITLVIGSLLTFNKGCLLESDKTHRHYSVPSSDIVEFEYNFCAGFFLAVFYLYLVSAIVFLFIFLYQKNKKKRITTNRKQTILPKNN